METSANPKQWFLDLMSEVEAFDAELCPPRINPDSDEQIVGTCPPELRNLYAFQQFCSREIDQAKLDLRHGSTEEATANHARLQQWNTKREVCRDIFAACLTTAFNDWGTQTHLHVRSEWKVIKCPSRSDSNPLEGLLRGLFGGNLPDLG